MHVCLLSKCSLSSMCVTAATGLQGVSQQLYATVYLFCAAHAKIIRSAASFQGNNSLDRVQNDNAFNPIDALEIILVVCAVCVHIKDDVQSLND